MIFNTHITEVVDFTKGDSAVGDKLQQISSDHNYAKANVKGKTALRDATYVGWNYWNIPLPQMLFTC